MALSFAVILSRMPPGIKGLIYGFGSAIPKAGQNFSNTTLELREKPHSAHIGIWKAVYE